MWIVRVLLTAAMHVPNCVGQNCTSVHVRRFGILFTNVVLKMMLSTPKVQMQVPSGTVHTFAIFSSELTMYWPLGEYWQHSTMPACPCRTWWLLLLFPPRLPGLAFQIRTVLSALPLQTGYTPPLQFSSFGITESETTMASWREKLMTSLPRFVSHTRHVLSWQPETRSFESGVKAQQMTTRGCFAVTTVPQDHVVVARARREVLVVRREGDAQNRVLVPKESGHLPARVAVPQSERRVLVAAAHVLVLLRGQRDALDACAVPQERVRVVVVQHGRCKGHVLLFADFEVAETEIVLTVARDSGLGLGEGSAHAHLTLLLQLEHLADQHLAVVELEELVHDVGHLHLGLRRRETEVGGPRRRRHREGRALGCVRLEGTFGRERRRVLVVVLVELRRRGVGVAVSLSVGLSGAGTSAARCLGFGFAASAPHKLSECVIEVFI
eukprot:PhM_4_TR10410/c1_g1_i2/m.73098